MKQWHTYLLLIHAGKILRQSYKRLTQQPTLADTVYMFWNKGFTITEMLIVVSIITVLITASAVGFLNASSRARDYKRVEGVKTISQALHQFILMHGDLPDEDLADHRGNWELSARSTGGTNTNFLIALVNEGILAEVPTDPLNIRDDSTIATASRPDGNFWFMYHYYDGYRNIGCEGDLTKYPCDSGCCYAGEYYGCEFDSNFAVIGFKSVEAIDPTNLQKAQCGKNTCTGVGEDLGGPNACRSWEHEFDYSLMVPI